MWPHQVSEVPATAAWALGFLWQHPEAVAEAIKQGAVEVMVSLLALQANRTQATEDQALKQAQHAAFALRVLLQGGGRDAVRRCEAVDGSLTAPPALLLFPLGRRFWPPARVRVQPPRACPAREAVLRACPEIRDRSVRDRRDMRNSNVCNTTAAGAAGVYTRMPER